MVSETEELEVGKLASLLGVNKEEALRLAIKEGYVLNKRWNSKTRNDEESIICKWGQYARFYIFIYHLILSNYKEGIHELRIRKATELYASGKVSVKQAARFAGLDLADWFVIAREKNLIAQIRPEELDEDVEAMQEL